MRPWPSPLCTLLVAVLTSACAARGPGAKGSRGAPVDVPQLRLEVAELSRNAEALLQKQDSQLWRAWTRGAPIQLEESYAGTDALFSAESIAKVDTLLGASGERPMEEQRALQHLKAFLVGEHLARASSEQAQAVANLEASLTFNEGGKERPYLELERQLAMEPDPARRRALYSAATTAVERLTQATRRRSERTAEVLRTLGYASPLVYALELRKLDAGELALHAEALLQKTQAAYTGVLEQRAKAELNLPLESLSPADLPRLFRPSFIDELFPKTGFVPRLHQVAADLGIDLSTLQNLTVDAEDTPVKHPRALCLGVKVPEDIRLSVKPGGGLKGEASALHELGLALFLTHVKQERFELSKLGAGSVGEAYGLLLEDLLVHPPWLAEKVKLKGERQARHLAAVNALRLFQLRRDAAKVLYALRLKPHATEEEARALYRSLFSRALGVSLDEAAAARHALEQDALLGAAVDLYGHVLSAQLAAALKKRFGDEAWRHPEAGKFLVQLWAEGTALGPRELGQKLGDGGIRLEPLLARFHP